MEELVKVKMIYNEDCPSCEFEFEVEQWEDGQCPKCKNKYTWDSQSLTDTEGNYDEWVMIMFETYEPKLDKMQWMNK